MPNNSIKKSLILAANPLHDELPRLRLDEEVKQIRTSLRSAENRNDFAIEVYRGRQGTQTRFPHLQNE